MFSQDIVSSDAFLDMPSSTHALYFHLGMNADDDGFVQPKKTMRLIGASDDDLKVLLAKRFILPFENGVVVIKHWLIHNLIRADLYKETQYKEEKKTLGLNDNGAYTELREGVKEIKQIEPPEWLKRRQGELRTASVPQSARRLGQGRVGKTTTAAAKAAADVPENTKEFIERCKASPQRHIQIIGEWAEAEDPKYTTKAQWNAFIKRNLRVATRLAPFSMEQIQAAYKRLVADLEREEGGKKVGFIRKFTLETLEKYI